MAKKQLVIMASMLFASIASQSQPRSICDLKNSSHAQTVTIRANVSVGIHDVLITDSKCQDKTVGLLLPADERESKLTNDTEYIELNEALRDRIHVLDEEKTHCSFSCDVPKYDVTATLTGAYLSGKKSLALNSRYARSLSLTKVTNVVTHLRNYQ